MITINQGDYGYFDKARQAALISDFSKVHIGCVAVYQGHIIGIACNTNKTHPMQKFYNRYRKGSDWIPKMYAEINVINTIRHLDIRFSKVKLYIYRIRCDQPFGLARPCSSCMKAIRDIGVKHIYYTTDDGFAYERIEKTKDGSIV